MPKPNRIHDVNFLAMVLPRMLGAAMNGHVLDPAKWTARQIDSMLGDVAEWGSLLSKDQVADLDRQLLGAGVSTLTSMLNSTVRRARRILRRGHLNGEDEWRVLTSLLNDTASQSLRPDERLLAESMVGSYESKVNVGNSAL